MTNSNEPANGTPKGAAERMIADAAPPAVSQATQFLELLGKDPAKTWFRTFKPSRSGASEHQGLDTRWITSKTAAGFNLYSVIGNATAATGKGGGVTDADITGVPALFVEWDDKPMEWQLTAWQTLKLPEPTVMVATGGPSLHCYWVLREPIGPLEWRRITARLIAHCSSDKACSNPSRLMRLPGSIYHDKKTGEPTGQCRIIAAAGGCYSAAEIEACLPAAAAAAPAKAAKAAPAPLLQQLPARELQEIQNAVAVLPHRSPQTYEQFRNALCGCSAALAEAGVVAADAEAINLMAHLWEGGEGQAAQILGSTTTRKATSFWAIAREHGYDLKRSAPAPAAKQQDKPAATASSKPSKPKPKAERKARHLSHTKAMACFDRCVEVQAQRERNSLRRRARLLKAAKDLGLAAYINRQEISQRVLEAKARCSGEGFKPLTAADRAAMPKPVVRWLVPGLIPANDLTIIGGRPKVGKTRVAVAIVAAVLRGEPFLEFSAPTSSPPVLLVTDDQSAGDTANMLSALDLWTHPRLIWSEHFRLTEPDLDALLAAIKANPGALVVLDSLRSIGRALQHGENEPEIGATLYDLKQSVIDAGGSLLLIHHCNKAVDLVGVEALSGHNAIAGAANTVITLHYCPDDKGLADKINPQRRLFSEGRSGMGCDVVIDRGANAGTYRKVNTFENWQQQLAEAKKNQKLDRLTNLQQQALDALSDSGQWMTRRQVCEAIGVAWVNYGRCGEARKVRDSLQRLADLGEVESVRAGTEATFRIPSHETQNDTAPTAPAAPTSEASASQGAELHTITPLLPRQPVTPTVLDESEPRAPTPAPHIGAVGAEWRPPNPLLQIDCSDLLARQERQEQPISDPQDLVEVIVPSNREENEQRIREDGRSTDLTGWSDADVAELLESLEQAAIRRRSSGLLGQEVAA
jgi:hypothetical protein